MAESSEPIRVDEASDEVREAAARMGDNMAQRDNRSEEEQPAPEARS